MAKLFIAVKNKVLKGGNHYISLDYGYTYKSGGFHKGIDLLSSDVAGKGADYITAIADGTVIDCKSNFSGTTKDAGLAGMGNYVRIKHADGAITRYMHMLKGSVKVTAGAKVKAGQVIGYMGNTGNSAGRHLHFDISYPEKIEGSYFDKGRYYPDPKPYLKGTKTISKKIVKPTPVNKADKLVVKVNTVLNVRKGAGTNYPVIKQLKNGTEVNKVSSKGDWIQIDKPVSGWVMNRYIIKK